MKTSEFLTLLQGNLDKELIFEYATNQFVGANYHITEVKNVDIKSVDCGGKPNNWKETVVQLWESDSEIGKTTYLKTEKALEIFERVKSINPLWSSTDIKFEYGNSIFHTAQLNVTNFYTKNNRLFIKLHSENTQCKATDVCGIPDKIEEINNESSSCCAPSSGCC